MLPLDRDPKIAVGVASANSPARGALVVVIAPGVMPVHEAEAGRVDPPGQVHVLPAQQVSSKRPTSSSTERREPSSSRWRRPNDILRGRGDDRESFRRPLDRFSGSTVRIRPPDTPYVRKGEGLDQLRQPFRIHHAVRIGRAMQSPRAARMPVLRAAAAPRFGSSRCEPARGTGRLIAGVSSVEPLSTTISPAGRRDTGARAATGGQASSVAAPLYTGTITLTLGSVPARHSAPGGERGRASQATGSRARSGPNSGLLTPQVSAVPLPEHLRSKGIPAARWRPRTISSKTGRSTPRSQSDNGTVNPVVAAVWKESSRDGVPKGQLAHPLLESRSCANPPGWPPSTTSDPAGDAHFEPMLHARPIHFEKDPLPVCR